MHWRVVMPYCSSSSSAQWLAPFVPPSRHTFEFTPAPSFADAGFWRVGRRNRLPLNSWLQFVAHASRAMADSRGSGIITHFPQLAAIAGLGARLARVQSPLLAVLFNVGHLYGGLQRQLTRKAVQRFSRICVSTRRESDLYSEWLSIPKSKFVFFPLQRPRFSVDASEERDQPFILCLGSARRDYLTFCRAMTQLKLPAVIVAAPHALAGIEPPPNVRLVCGGVPADECRRLALRARVIVIPLDTADAAAGTVTVSEAMRMGRPIIATRCAGTEDYIESGRTGLLVEPHSSAALADAILRLWEDDKERARIGAAAAGFAEERLSDEAAGRRLATILDEIEKEWECRSAN